MASTLPASGVDRERISTVCCYAPLTLSSNNSSKCSEVKESRRATAPMKGHANGQGEPAELDLPLSYLLPVPPLPTPLKSNLKGMFNRAESTVVHGGFRSIEHTLRDQSERASKQQEMEMDERRKVSWPDAHGRDLAHVQVFHSSVPEEGDFLVRGKSCICNIQ